MIDLSTKGKDGHADIRTRNHTRCTLILHAHNRKVIGQIASINLHIAEIQDKYPQHMYAHSASAKKRFTMDSSRQGNDAHKV